MLVINRGIGEKVLIGDAVVTCVAIGKNKVKLGIEAPQSCKIVRTELLEGKHGNQQDPRRN